MSEILTTEQVAAIKLTLPLTPWSHSSRVTLYQLCATTEALRAQPSEAQQQLADEQVQWSNTCTGWALAMEEMEADVRALAEALRIHSAHNHTFDWCLGCRSRRDEALARPGVRRLLGEKE